MTAIAYRDGVLAADSMISMEGTFCGHTKKIAKSSNGALAGACGAFGDNVMFLDWFRKGMTDKAPSFQERFDGIVILPNRKTYYVASPCVLCQFTQPFSALGCGIDVMTGAMEMGATPEEAVKIAIKYCDGVGGRIHTLKLGD